MLQSLNNICGHPLDSHCSCSLSFWQSQNGTWHLVVSPLLTKWITALNLLVVVFLKQTMVLWPFFAASVHYCLMVSLSIRTPTPFSIAASSHLAVFIIKLEHELGFKSLCEALQALNQVSEWRP